MDFLDLLDPLDSTVKTVLLDIPVVLDQKDHLDLYLIKYN